MSPSLQRFVFLGLRGLLTLAFGAAGAAKLAGVPDMVAVFDVIGWGQWFRYVTGLIEVGSAILLWLPATRILASGLLICTMIGAILAHVLVLGPSLVPALILGLIATAVLWHDTRGTTLDSGTV